MTISIVKTGSSAAPPALSLATELSFLLSAFSAVTQDLFASVAFNSSTARKVSATYIATLQSLDQQLVAVLSTLPIHARNEARIAGLVKEIREYDSSWKEEVIAAETIRKELHELIREGKRDRERIVLADKGSFIQFRYICILSDDRGSASPKPDDILALGRKLAPFTAAPLPLGQKAVGAPFPTEEVMRRGRLGLGEQIIEHVGELQEHTGGWYSLFLCMTLADFGICRTKRGKWCFTVATAIYAVSSIWNGGYYGWC